MRLAQALYRRFITPRGMLRGSSEAEQYGFDVAGRIGSVGSREELASLPLEMAAEAKHDDRVASVRAELASIIESQPGLLEIYVDLFVIPIEGIDPFVLSLQASQAGVKFIGSSSL
jgi:hypothetical protein